MSKTQFPPSKRGLANIKEDLMLDLNREMAALTPYDEKLHPDGLIDIGSSLNELMLAELERYFEKKIKVDFRKVLPYGATAGSSALNAGVAKFVNKYFHPTRNIELSNILCTNGVTSLLDILPFAICDPGEAVMYTTPVYGMFKHDIDSRNNITIVEVPCQAGFDQFTVLTSALLILKFEAALRQARGKGIKVRAVLICNPCNPLGRCYSRTTLVELARFCQKEDLHLISDEIYAMSVFSNNESEVGNMDGFTSVLSIESETGIDGRNIHVLWGTAKDFGLGGLRLGFMITRNDILKEACRRLAMFTWITSFSDSTFTQLLNDDKYLDEYFCTYQARLSQAYTQTTKFLKQHGISYQPANAGLFIWIDLSAYLDSSAGRTGNNSRPELALARWLMTKGVYLEPGLVFFSPTPGRFRLAYTSNQKTVKVGLQRLVNALGEYKGLDDGTSTLTNIEKTSTIDHGSPVETTSRFWRGLCF